MSGNDEFRRGYGGEGSVPHYGRRREKTVLATKVYADMQDELDGPNRERGLSAYKIRRHLEGSLRRLQTDHVELYQMHHIDRSVTWEELWGAFVIA